MPGAIILLTNEDQQNKIKLEGEKAMKENQIKSALAYKGMSINQLAEMFPYSRQNLTRKIKQGTLTDEELSTIANAIGATYKCYFQFDDGKEI